MRIKVVLHYLGLLITGLGVSMLLPLGWSLYYNEPVSSAFTISIGICAGSGLLLWRLTPGGEIRFSRREAIMLVAGAWVLASAFGAIPYALAGTFPSYLDAYFESMSGFTSTGASVLANVEIQPQAILLWRNLAQWLGGMGIITLFVALFPIFGIGAAYLVEAETPQAERLTARIRDTAKSLWYLYLGFTTLEILLLWQAGRIPIFDAMTVTFGTMPTGGFCAKNLSIAAYNSLTVECIVIAFMTIAGINFGLYYFLFWKRQPKRLFTNPEFRLYIALLTGASIFIALNLMKGMGLSAGDAFRYAGFNTVSIGTSTGFSTIDFNLWPAFAKTALLMLMIVGGSAGSTAGGIKVIRLLVLFKYVYRRITSAFNPKAVIPIKVGGNVLSEGVVSKLMGMTILYLTVLIVSFLIMTAVGLDQVSALSSVAATMGMVGPGLGLVGPMANYLFIPPLGKVVLIVCMLAGRLELFTVFAILAPSFWKWR
jgi:trk system potassium uptake protein TrkH